MESPVASAPQSNAPSGSDRSAHSQRPVDAPRERFTVVAFRRATIGLTWLALLGAARTEYMFFFGSDSKQSCTVSDWLKAKLASFVTCENRESDGKPKDAKKDAVSTDDAKSASGSSSRGVGCWLKTKGTSFLSCESGDKAKNAEKEAKQKKEKEKEQEKEKEKTTFQQQTQAAVKTLSDWATPQYGAFQYLLQNSIDNTTSDHAKWKDRYKTLLHWSAVLGLAYAALPSDSTQPIATATRRVAGFGTSLLAGLGLWSLGAYSAYNNGRNDLLQVQQDFRLHAIGKAALLKTWDPPLSEADRDVLNKLFQRRNHAHERQNKAFGSASEALDRLFTYSARSTGSALPESTQENKI